MNKLICNENTSSDMYPFRPVFKIGDFAEGIAIKKPGSINEELWLIPVKNIRGAKEGWYYSINSFLTQAEWRDKQINSILED
jgi:hypothetical protein